MQKDPALLPFTLLIFTEAAAIIIGSILVGCQGPSSVDSPTLSMEAQAWEFRYSPNMPNNPSPAINGGWQFDFPMQDGVHYLMTPYSSDLLNHSIKVSGEIVGNDPVFTWHQDNCLNTPARARIIVQQQRDDLTKASGRWWSADSYIDLRISSFTITAPIEPKSWSNVDGMTGLADPTGFNNAMQNPGHIGLTFSGGCFFGHGTWLESGAARMIVKEIQIL